MQFKTSETNLWMLLTSLYFYHMNCKKGKWTLIVNNSDIIHLVPTLNLLFWIRRACKLKKLNPQVFFKYIYFKLTISIKRFLNNIAWNEQGIVNIYWDENSHIFLHIIGLPIPRFSSSVKKFRQDKDTHDNYFIMALAIVWKQQWDNTTSNFT